jgi:predicted ester cyclase
VNESESAKATIRMISEAIDAGNLEVLDDHPGYWQTREFMPRLKEAFPDLRHSIQAQIAEGDMVATFSIVSGTHEGPFFGIPASGRRVSFQHLDLDRVVEGRVVSHNAESGWLGVLLEWGVLPLQREAQ